MSKNTYGLIAAILSPFFSSISTIFKSGATKSLGVLPVVGIGGALGAIILFLLAKFRGEKISWKKIKKNRQTILTIVVLRFLLGELLFTYGLYHTSAIKAIFFTKIEPYFVLLFAWFFFKEKIEKKYLVLLAIHLSGALLLSTGGKFSGIESAQIGDIFIILAMAFFASTYTQGKKLAEELGPVLSSAVSYSAAAFIILPFVLIFTPLNNLGFPSQGWLYLILNVFLFNVIALSLWFASLKTVKGWMVSALRYLGPILGAPVAYLLLGDSLDGIQIIGAFIIILTSFWIAREHLKTAKKSPIPDEE